MYKSHIENAKSLVGLTILDVRQMTIDEAKLFGWDRFGGKLGWVINLSDGTLLVSSSDDEMNFAGALYVNRENEEFILPTQNI